MRFRVLKSALDGSIQLVPDKSHFSLIWMHGLGDSAEGFREYFQLPQSPVPKGCRMTLLTAP